ncbi:APC family permease [Actinoallomurus sp. NPDC052274]|uniref:APC family permease n=1 Tax=Actinoallomurus sp. NPDC052274 TaxID=3155420 RepID=UPI00344989F3
MAQNSPIHPRPGPKMTVAPGIPRSSEAGIGLKRHIGLGGLLLATLASMIGSGWLFGPLYAARLAGPSAIIAWLIGGGMFMLFGLVYSELGALFPVSGGVVRFPHYAFGPAASYIVGWIVYLGAVTFPAIEVEAALQYASNYLPALTHVSDGVQVLTAQGYAVAALLMVSFTVINLWGVRAFARANNAIMAFKLFVMVSMLIAFLAVGFGADKLTDFGGFAPHGAGGILSAVATGGVAFSFTGFQQPVALSGEVRRPGRNIPRAILLGLLITTVLYCLIELAFLGAVPAGALRNGWGHVAFANDFGPLAGVATMLGLGWVAALLYVDAVISPLDCGLNWSVMTSRISYGMARNSTIPAVLGRVSGRGVPWVSVLVGSGVGFVLFLPFPGWQTFVGFITSAAVLSYGTGPLAHAALRRQLPDHVRGFRTSHGDLVPFVAFYAGNLIVVWTGWQTIEKLLVAIAVGIVIFAVQRLTQRTTESDVHWKAAAWIIPWLGGLAVISALSTFGGRSVIPFGFSFLAIFALSFVVYVLAVRLRLPTASMPLADTGTDERAVEPSEHGPAL